MTKTNSSPFRLSQVVIESFSIKRKPGEQGKFNIKIKPSGVINSESKDFLLTLDLRIKDDSETFDIKLSVLGYFNYEDVDGEEHLNDYFYTNASALVFPFIRSYVSAVTALSGLDAITLPIMNLTNLKSELKKNTINLSDLADGEIEP